MTYVSDKYARTLKALGTLNLMPFVFMLVWIVFVIAVYANPKVPSIRWSAGFLGNEPGIHHLFMPHDKFIIICNALRIIALIFAFFQFASLIVGYAAVKKLRCVKVWQILCIINIMLCVISTNVISAGIIGYIFARLSNIKVDSDIKSDIICQ